MNKKERKIFMFIRTQMNLGGLQKYIITLIRRLIKENYLIIWIAPKGKLIVDKGFEKDLFNSNVLIIQEDFNDFFWLKKIQLPIKVEDKVETMGFFITDYIYFEYIKRRYRKVNFKNIFWVAHFEGIGSKSLPKIIKPLVDKYFNKKIQELDEHNNIFYNNIGHLKYFENKYNYKVKFPSKKIYLKSPNREFTLFKEELVKNKYRSESFNILTISRFDFPHKGYLLGLIDNYVDLKKKYKNIKLFIIGYGEGKNQVLEKINNISNEIKKDIYLIGKVEYDKLNQYFDKVDLYIGLAGTVRDAALNSVISIPVRHYSLVCEGYGFLPESKEFIISNKKGNPIEKYIEEAINLNEEEYINLSKASYNTFEVDPNYRDPALDLEPKNSEKIISNSFILGFRILKQLSILIKTKGWKHAK